MAGVKTCNHCGKKINAKQVICPLCGGRVTDPVEPRPAVCPRCKTALKTQVQRGEEYDLCERCGGLWLDRAEFRNATTEARVYRDEAVQGEYLRGPWKDPGGYLPCVRCGTMMNRKNFARISGVLIDECGGHGVWLDAGELEKIRQFIVDGGLEAAQDKEIERARIELEQLSTRVGKIGLVQGMIHFWNIKRWMFG